MFEEQIFTIEEVSQYLKVPVEAVQREIDAGRLRALNVAGFIRIREFDLASYKNEAKMAIPADPAIISTRSKNGPQLDQGADFSHTWPDGKTEVFGKAREGVASYAGRDHHIKLGFTVRHSAGQPRLRCLVLVDRYPTVEFVAADANDGPTVIASIIKDCEGKQVPVGVEAPTEYVGLPIGPYRSVVNGPGAPNGSAVICKSDDFETMVRHALIRYDYREQRSQIKKGR